MASYLSLAEAKLQLNITGTQNDNEIQEFVDAACGKIEDDAGPIATVTITSEFVDLQGRTIFNELTTAGTRAFVLRHRPVQSIQAISSAIVAGIVYTPSDFWIDTATGIVRRFDGGTIFGPLKVDYTAGYAATPAWALLAAKVTVQYLWQTQRGSGSRRPGTAGGVDAPLSGSGFLLPPMAQMLIERHTSVPAVG